MRKAGVVVYGVAAYVVFVGVFLYAIGFVEDVGVPRSLDGPSTTATLPALAADALLLALFAVQHSVMARPAFKRWWTRLVPREAERSTYVLLSGLALALVFWQWRPATAVVWRVDPPAAAVLLRATSVLGWLVALASTFMISHLDLFGLRQVWLHARGVPYRPTGFTTRMLYRFLRHPIMLGFLLAFWATPKMTAGHLLFAVLTTGYILVGIQLEERDLLAELGERYATYRRDVPMLLPRTTRTARSRPATSAR
jgi:methanethiol S-methyltransferase